MKHVSVMTIVVSLLTIISFVSCSLETKDEGYKDKNAYTISVNGNSMYIIADYYPTYGHASSLTLTTPVFETKASTAFKVPSRKFTFIDYEHSIKEVEEGQELLLSALSDDDATAYVSGGFATIINKSDISLTIEYDHLKVSYSKNGDIKTFVINGTVTYYSSMTVGQIRHN